MLNGFRMSQNNNINICFQIRRISISTNANEIILFRK